jgi:hypothetical protein
MKTMLAPKSTVLKRNRVMSDNAANGGWFCRFPLPGPEGGRRACDMRKGEPKTAAGETPIMPPSMAVARRLRFSVTLLVHLKKQHLCQGFGRQHAVADIGRFRQPVRRCDGDDSVGQFIVAVDACAVGIRKTDLLAQNRLLRLRMSGPCKWCRRQCRQSITAMNVVRCTEFPNFRRANEKFLAQFSGTKIPAAALLRRAEGKSPSPNPRRLSF